MYKNDRLIKILIFVLMIEVIYFILNLLTKGVDIYYLFNLIRHNPIANKFDNYWTYKTNIIYYSSITIQLLTIIPLITWIYREYTNVQKIYLKEKLSYNPIWAIFSFVIPIFNFFAPYKIMTEIVEGYQYDRKLDNSVLNRKQIKLWWIGFLLFVIFSRMISTRSVKYAEDYLTNSYRYIVINICGLVSAISLIWILKHLRNIINNSNEQKD